MHEMINSNSPPLIGIIICERLDQKQFISSSYISAIAKLGGNALVIPYTSRNRPLSLSLSLFDGFLFCGGGDITPLLFKQPPLYCSTPPTDYDFDLFQISLMIQILDTKKPLLCICRGMQILNVALGGTLYQDLSLFPKTTYEHMQQTVSRSDPSHTIHIKSHSLLYKIVQKTRLQTNSYHHQSIHCLGKNLKVCARTSDGIKEALELPTAPFVLGVQWHPECMLDTSSDMYAIFQSFLASCKISSIF